MSQWEAPDVKTWMKEARLLQHIMFCRLGDREWDVWDKSNENILFYKIGFGLFCLSEISPECNNPENNLPGNIQECINLENQLPDKSPESDNPENSSGYDNPENRPEYDNPKNTPDSDDLENSLPKKIPEYDNPTGYSQAQFTIIKSVAGVILKNTMSDSTIHFATIFVFGKIKKKRFKVPVFKVKGKNNQTLFVDSDSRVYENWQCYLDTNNLPKCMYCYPRDGLYQEDVGEVLVDFSTPPACRKNTNVGPATEVCFTSTSDIIISSFIDYLVPFPEVTQKTEVPITTVRPGKRNTREEFLSRSIENLVNRHLHGQSIGLNDSETRMAWLSIVSCVLEFVQNSMYEGITRNAAAGEVPEPLLRTIYDIVTIGSLTVNYLGTASCLFSLVDKVDESSLNCNISDITATTLFFSNMHIRKGTAKEIIQKAQEQVLSDHRNNLSQPQLEAHSRLIEQVPGEAPLQKNANKVKAIKDIFDERDFYNCLVKAKSDLEDHHVQYSLEEPGLININNELNIAPNKLIEIKKRERKMILDASKDINNGEMNHKRLNEIEKLLKNKRIQMEFQRRETVVVLKRAFKVENLKSVQIGSVKIFEKMKPSELDSLSNTITALGKEFNHKILEIAAEFAEKRQCEILRDFISYLQITMKYLYNLKAQYVKEFEDEVASKRLTSNEINKLAHKKGITGKRAQYFLNKAINNFYTDRENSFESLMQFYASVEGEVQPHNEKAKTRFTSTPNAVYHLCKHRDFGGEKLTAEQYFAIASELVEEPLNRSVAQLNQQGDKTIIAFTNPVNGAYGVVYQTLADGKRSLATLFYDSRVFNKSLRNENLQ